MHAHLGVLRKEVLVPGLHQQEPNGRIAPQCRSFLAAIEDTIFVCNTKLPNMVYH
jgi:hypothetical protein